MLQVRAYQVWNRWLTKFQTWPKENSNNSRNINNTKTAYMGSSP